MTPPPGSRHDVLYLVDSWRWFGRHSGYAALLDFTTPEQQAELFLSGVPSKAGDFRNRIAALLNGGAWCCTGRDRAQEAAFMKALEHRSDASGHLLYYERHHPMFRDWKKAPNRLMATIHHPPDQLCTLHGAVVEDLSRLSSALVLYQRDLAFFESRVGKGRVKFVHHGVDTDFFKPAVRPSDEHQQPRLLFVGVNGRNFKTLYEVIREVSQSHPEVEFDLLVPSRRGDPRNHVYFSLLKRNPKVTWHSGLDDDGLLKLYQASDLLLLPLDYAGACNAHVEALACGLPVITTDVGGVRDYGAGSLFPVIDPGDSAAMAALVSRYLTDRDWYGQVSTACRRFAEEVLAWPIIYRAHLDAYQGLRA